MTKHEKCRIFVRIYLFMEKVTLYSVDINPELAPIVDKLVKVQSSYKSGENWRHLRQVAPGNTYFDDVETFTTDEESGVITLNYKNGQVKLLEPTDQGCDYRLWDGADKTTAKRVTLFVHADPVYDFHSVNIGVELSWPTPDKVIVKNITTVNGVPFEEAQTNKELRFKNFQWYFHGIEDGQYTQGGFIASDNVVDLIRGAGDKRFAIITRDPNEPILSKSEILDDGSNGAHYYLDYENEVKDADFEFLVLMMYNRDKSIVRPDMEPAEEYGDVWLPLNELFPPKKPTK